MKKIISVLVAAVILFTFVLPCAVFADGEKSDAADSVASEVVTTTGETDSATGLAEGSGDYTGGEVVFDEEGEIEEIVGEDAPEAESSSNKIIYAAIAAGVIVIAVAACAVVLRKKSKKNAEE